MALGVLGTARECVEADIKPISVAIRGSKGVRRGEYHDMMIMHLWSMLNDALIDNSYDARYKMLQLYDV